MSILNLVSSSAPLSLGNSKTVKGRNFLTVEPTLFRGKVPVVITLLSKVLEVTNESLNFKSPVPKGFYGYILPRRGKTPITEPIPLSFREEEIPLYSVAESTGNLFFLGLLAQILSGGPAAMLVEPLKNTLISAFPVPAFNNVLIKTHKSIVRVRLAYRVLNLPDNPFSEEDIIPFQPHTPDESPYWPEIPSGNHPPTLEDSSYGGDFDLENPLEDLDLDFEARDVVYGTPSPWFLLPREWSAPFDLPFVYEEPRGGGQCYKQVRTRVTGKPLSPGGVVPCSDWKVEIRVKP